MNKISLSYFLIFSVSVLLSLGFVYPARKLAHRFGIVDLPDQRKSHGNRMPCLGGLAIFCTFQLIIILGITFLYLDHTKLFLSESFPHLSGILPLVNEVRFKLFSILGGAAVIFIMGLTDDKIGVRFDYRLKFLIQILVAIWMVSVGVRIDFLQNAFLNSCITVFWIVGITNAFNLLDNMDGLSSGVAYICSMLFFFIAAKQDQYFVALIYITMAGSLLGFLYHNFNPARIFLGDNGSLLVGFLLAVLTVVQSFTTPSSSGLFPVLTPLIILSLPIFDTSRVMVIRWVEKRPLFQGDRRHISHRLCEMGMSVRQSVLTVYLMTLVLGLGSTVLDVGDRTTNIILLLQVLSMITLLSFLMAFTHSKSK